MTTAAREDGLDPVTRLAHELFEDPRTRPVIEEQIAVLHPERAAIAVPGHALRQEFAKEREALHKERDELRAERAQEKANRDAELARAEWFGRLAKHGARRDELEGMTKFALERKNGDPESVVDAYRKQQRLAEPSPGRFTPTIPGVKAGEFFKGLDENPDRWAKDTAARDIEIIRTHGLGALETMAPSPLR